MGVAALALVLPAQAAVRAARFWATASGTQSVSWTEVDHFVGGDCFHMRYQRGWGNERVEFRGQRTKAYAAMSGRTLMIGLGEWSFGATPYPFMTVFTQIARDGAYAERTTPGSCGGTSSSSVGHYDCGKRSGTEALEVRLTSTRRAVAYIGEHPLYKPANGFDTCPLVEPVGIEAAGFTQVASQPVNVKAIFNPRTGRIVLEATKQFRDQPNIYTTTAARVQWKITLDRVPTRRR